VPTSIVRGRAVPDDPVTFGRGLVAGVFGADDLDPRHSHHLGWLVQACAFLGTLDEEHQAWLRRARELDPRAYPDEVLLPADDEAVLAALDAVMRRG